MLAKDSSGRARKRCSSGGYITNQGFRESAGQRAVATRGRLTSGRGGGRDVESIVRFLNAHTGSHRGIYGDLLPDAGLVATLDFVVRDFMLDPSRELVDHALAASQQLVRAPFPCAARPRAAAMCDFGRGHAALGPGVSAWAFFAPWGVGAL